MSAVTVDCCVVYPCCMGVFGMFAVMPSLMPSGSSPVSLQLLRSGIWACMRYHCLCLCWVWDVVVVIVCHDQVRFQVSQGFRCRDS